MVNIRYIFGILKFPLIVAAIFLLYHLLWQIFNLPPKDELVKIIENWFLQYGLWIVFASAIVEGTLLAGNYFPGGVIIFLGVITAGDDLVRVVGVVAVVSLAFLIAYGLNYILGKYGWYRLFVRFGLKEQLERARVRVEQRVFKAVVLSYWQPNLAALTSTAAGIMTIPFKKFLLQSAIGILIWNTFWGTVVHLLREKALDAVTNIKLLFLVMLVWAVTLLVFDYFKRRKIEATKA